MLSIVAAVSLTLRRCSWVSDVYPGLGWLTLCHNLNLKDKICENSIQNLNGDCKVEKLTWLGCGARPDPRRWPSRWRFPQPRPLLAPSCNWDVRISEAHPRPPRWSALLSSLWRPRSRSVGLGVCYAPAPAACMTSFSRNREAAERNKAPTLCAQFNQDNRQACWAEVSHYFTAGTSLMRRQSGLPAQQVGETNQLYLSDTKDAVLCGFVSCYRKNIQAISAHQRVVHLCVWPDVCIQGSNQTHHSAELTPLRNTELIHTLKEETTYFLIYTICLYVRIWSHSGMSETFGDEH